MVGACLYLYTCLTFNILNFFVKPAHKYPNSMLPMLPTFTLPLCYHHQLITRQLDPLPHRFSHYCCLSTAFVCVSSHCYCFCSTYHFTYHQATPKFFSLIALCAPSLLLTSCLTTPMHTETCPDTSSPWLWQKLKYGRITPIIFCFTSIFHVVLRSSGQRVHHACIMI
jgi:hypothetical protein